MTRFDPSKRDRLLSVLREGRSVTEAAASVGISTTTIAKWAARGRASDADAEHREFACSYDAIRQGHTSGHPTSDDDAPLSEDDVRRLLEKSARAGSVTAQRTLLTELRRLREAREHADELRAMGLLP